MATSKHILVVDDDSYVRESTEEILRRKGYQVDTSANGKDALVLLDEADFDLILSDIKMPEMDGIELSFDDSALRHIVKLTITKGTGARGLRAVLESSMLDLMYLLPSEGGPEEIHVTEELITNPQSAFLPLEQKKRA